MEYLTLQDIPHRHYNPLHTHRMTMGSMAAVRSNLPDPFSPYFPPRHVSSVLPRTQSVIAGAAPVLGQQSNTGRHSSFPTTWHPVHHPLASDDYNYGKRWFSAADADTRYLQARTKNSFLENEVHDKFLMSFQNPHSRSSPPIQPNEHGYSEKLPSFSEFLDKTRADTPPHTPSRSQGSHDASPHTARPQFDDVAWKEGGHRRNDTLGDPLTEDHRRRSSAVDPSLAMRHPTAFASVYAQEQRPSFSYARPHPPASYDAQQQLYRHSPSHPGLTGGAYAPATGPTLAGPTHRQSYYQEHRPPPQPYDYRSSYSSGPHAGYETGYGEVRFQQHVGADPNNFNRKRRGNLPKEATNVLKHWFSEHRSQPYPTEDQKIELCNITGLSMNQVSNWFINARRRQPAKEAREREANGGQPAQPAQPAQAAQAAER